MPNPALEANGVNGVLAAVFPAFLLFLRLGVLL